MEDGVAKERVDGEVVAEGKVGGVGESESSQGEMIVGAKDGARGRGGDGMMIEVKGRGRGRDGMMAKEGRDGRVARMGDRGGMVGGVAT